MDQDLLLNLYQQMFLIRSFENKAFELHQAGEIAGPLHLSSGQEALAVGALSVLEEEDTVLSSFRCHSYYLARGGDPKRAFAELFGKASGCSGGRGGSMHLFDTSHNFMGGWGIIGAHIPLAAGFAFADKYRKTKGVTLCFFGDGAVNIGAFHEGLALAELWKLPVVFIIENNQYAMNTAVNDNCSLDDLSLRALAYPLPRASVDGQDVFAVRSTIHTAIRRAREKQQPTLIEARTVRLAGFSADECTTDNSDSEQDPLSILEEKLKGLNLRESVNKIRDRITREIDEAVHFAKTQPAPHPDTAQEHIFAAEQGGLT